MPAIHVTRVERLKRLEALLPRNLSPDQCLDGVRLLAIMGAAYGEGDEKARRRSLQNDLKELVDSGRIEAVNPGGKPLRYRRVSDDPRDDPAIWRYTLALIRDLVAEAVPRRQLDRLWQRLLTEVGGPLLDETRLRVLPDALRLRPVELYPEVLGAVIAALAQRRALQVRYCNAAGERSDVCLHPQALVQRGPIPYLFALKNDEDEPLRLYALQRMLRAKCLAGTGAREMPGFELNRAIAEGLVDFGQGESVALELRVRGYLATVIRDCPLADDQRLEDEPPESEFDARVWARVPSTGQLLRWLLGAGDNLEVVAPLELRRVVAVQAAKMAGIYGDA